MQQGRFAASDDHGPDLDPKLDFDPGQAYIRVSFDGNDP